MNDSIEISDNLVSVTDNIVHYDFEKKKFYVIEWISNNKGLKYSQRYYIE